MREGAAMRLLLALLVVEQVNSSLLVYNLKALQVVNPSPTLSNMSYSIANFGFSPFGKTIISHLALSPQSEKDECKETSSDFHKDIENSFLLIPRGGCTFTKKAINAQSMGAQLAIIMDNDKHENKIIMKDDGYGYKVNIPAIFINQEDGDRLIYLINSSKKNKVIMKIVFENIKTDMVDLTFWLQANNRHSYALVNKFQQYFEPISSFINFKVVYATQSCHRCLQDDCYFNNKYCAINIVHRNSDNGKMVLDQQIRESVIFQHEKQSWWAYMSKIDKECFKISQMKECSEKCAKAVRIDNGKVEKNFGESFQSNGGNKYLQEYDQKLLGSGIHFFPTVTINQVKMRGQIQAKFIIDDICNTLKSPPSECDDFINEDSSKTLIFEHGWLILLISILGLIIFSSLFCLYRRYIRKKMKGQMRGRVDDMVSKYIEFYSERK